jgi:hypothetical protein
VIFFKVYFSCRDGQNKSHIAWVDVDVNEPFKVVTLAQKPLLAPGVIGAFDDSGVSLSCIATIGGKKFLYYLGWNLGVTVPWRNSIGLAIYNDSTKEFERHSTAPLLDRNEVDPFSISYPFVMPDNGVYRMWYGSNLRWGKEQEDMAHIIKYAESKDGIMWKREGKIALNLENENEYAISRPYVIKEKNMYRMWYSFRGKSYRIGYAESGDGIKWTRMDEKAGLDVSQTGWDSEMICYPFLFDHKGKRYMLYNGNGYGRTGFGLAIMEN